MDRMQIESSVSYNYAVLKKKKKEESTVTV